MIQDGYRDLRVPDDSGRSARDGPAELPGHPVRICRFPPVRHLNGWAGPLGVADRHRDADLYGRRAVVLDVPARFAVHILARCGDRTRRDRRRQRYRADRRVGRRGDRRRRRRVVMRRRTAAGRH
ncbi:hypothetical protein [Streptomyces mirabilis]|uniref:hypothetical protein n=1 Tax=Streptomyces mirabilis TaxID=68239 RepID=UPI0036A73070